MMDAYTAYTFNFNFYVLYNTCTAKNVNYDHNKC